MKKVVIISVVIVSMALIGLAVAGPGGGGWHRSPEEKIAYMKSKITDKLDLNETQKTTLDRIADEMLAECSQLKNNREAFKNSLTELLAKESVSSDELKALFDTKKPVIEDMMAMASGYIAEFHSVLTPEQRAVLVEEIKSNQGRRCRFMR